MVRFQSCLLMLALLMPALLTGQTAARREYPRFYPDDPIAAEPRPMAVGVMRRVEIYNLYDYLYQSLRPRPVDVVAAGGVNTLGEVPDSDWFTNRHGRRRLSARELRRGPGDENAPRPPYLIVGAKTEGITPGFRMRDAAGRLYFVKPDPPASPELISAADVMGSKFFYAIGYNTPENYIVRMRPTDWNIDPQARVSLPGRLSRRMAAKDMDEVLDRSALLPDGSVRVIASLALPGQGIGPFRYEGVRSDDPNDLVPHENRRDLRGLFIFCAWLNHTDSKGSNSYDTVLESAGTRFVRHYLIDFASAFGSDGDRIKDARFGYAYQIPTTAGALLAPLQTLGLLPQAWEKARYPYRKNAGRIESEIFDPDHWVPNYPNPAFLRRQPADDYWAAKIVMAFTDEDIRALVETGEYSDPATVDYLVKTLAARRDKIGRACMTKVLPLENFALRDGKLVFDDLAVRYGFGDPATYRISWAEYDNAAAVMKPLSGETSFQLPSRFAALPDGAYLAATIDAANHVGKNVTVFLRKKGDDVEVAGIDRK